MKTLFSVMSLLVLVSCGGKNSDSSPSPKVFPQCGDRTLTGSLCMIRPQWSIISSSVNFPEKFKIKLNEHFVIDTCKAESGTTVLSENGNKIIQFKLPYLPMNEALKVEIIDLGVKCDNNALFHLEESVMYGVIEMTSGGNKTYSVSVDLNN